MSRRLLTVVTVVAGIAGLGLPAAWFTTRAPKDAGSTELVERVARPVPSTAAARIGPRVDAAQITVRSGRIGDLEAAQRSAPVRLRVDAIGVDAPVVAVGKEANGEMEIPSDVAEIGWYAPGPAPGQVGSAVLAGHVDSRSQGRGAFFSLRDLEPGDRLTVTDDRGRATEFEVHARRQYAKGDLPTDAIFATTGLPRLALITCGGDFDRSRSSYRDNVVVYALAVGLIEASPAAG